MAKWAIFLLPVLGFITFFNTIRDFAINFSQLRIKEIRVAGCQNLTPDYIAGLSRIRKDSNILTVSLSETINRIKKNPWIDKVVIERKLPHEIRIIVRERKAQAIINLDDLYLVDRNGIVFKKVEREDSCDLPVLTGIKKEDLEKNGKTSRRLIKVALSLMRVFEQSPALIWGGMSEINMDEFFGFTIYTLNDAIPIKIGFGDFKSKCERANLIVSDLKSKADAIKSIDLRFKHKIFAKIEPEDRQERILVVLRERGGIK